MFLDIEIPTAIDINTLIQNNGIKEYTPARILTYPFLKIIKPVTNPVNKQLIHDIFIRGSNFSAYVRDIFPNQNNPIPTNDALKAQGNGYGKV